MTNTSIDTYKPNGEFVRGNTFLPKYILDKVKTNSLHLAVGRDDNVYFSYAHAIFKQDKSGRVTTIAGKVGTVGKENSCKWYRRFILWSMWTLCR